MSAQRAATVGEPQKARGQQCSCGRRSQGGGECPQCRKKRRRALLRRSAFGSREAAPRSLPPVVDQVLSSPGQPLDAASRSFMEPRFGSDFSRVRVHTSARAAESARAIRAAAYTAGRDIVFGAGRFAPHTVPGRRLLAHELTHVVQQRGPARGFDPPGSWVVDADPAAEREASRIGRQVAEERQPARHVSRLATGALQRQDEEAFTDAAQLATEGEKPGGGEKPACFKKLSADEFDTVTRLDTITVIVLSSKFCGNCDALKSVLESICEKKYQGVEHPLRVRFYVIDVDPMDDEGSNIETAEAKKNRAIGKRFGAPPVPHLLIYVEHELERHSEGYLGSPEIYEHMLATIYEDAATTGTETGLKWGGIVGAVVGAVAGVSTGVTLANAGMAGGWAFLAGLGVAAGIALVGLGLGALFGWLFGASRGTSKLSKERLAEVKAYAAALTGGKNPENASDELARDTIDYWANHPEDLQLTVDARRRLIQQLLDGPTLDADERAIIKVLENSKPEEILELLDSKKGLSFQDLDKNIDGAEWRTTLDLLETRFPELGSGEGIQREGELRCSTGQALMLHAARRRAASMVEHTIDLLGDHLSNPAANSSTRSALDCYFPSAEPNQVRQVRDTLQQVKTILPTRRYRCAAGGMSEFHLRRPGDHREVHLPCISELAAGIVSVEGKVLPEVFVCWDFFTKLDPRFQAVTVIHESVHSAGLLEDPRYQPGCGLALQTALKNPDSYAYLAASLERAEKAAGGAGSGKAPEGGK